jgi:subtilisin family serine protease
MRRRSGFRLVVLCVVVLLSVAVGMTPAGAREGEIGRDGGAELVPGSYLVKLRKGVVTEENLVRVAGGLAERHGGSVGAVYTSTLGFLLEVSDEAAARRLAADPAVAYVHQDTYIDSLDFLENPWGNDRIPWNTDRLDERAPVYDTEYDAAGTGAGVTVYAIDTGLDHSHRAFGGRATSGWDFVDDDPDAEECYRLPRGHGTFVAAIAAGTYQFSVAPEANVVGLRVYPCDGRTTTALLVEAIDWVTNNAVRPAVINFSIGLDGGNDSLNDAVDAAVESGIVFVAAAGNDNADACDGSPADGPSAIIVAGSTITDSRMAISDYGSCVDIFAPGEGIESLYPYTPGTALRSGTSAATPHVAGMAAVILSVHPTWSPALVWLALRRDATTGVLSDIGPGSPDLLLHSWTGIDSLDCWFAGQLTCAVSYHDWPNTTATVEWYTRVNHGPTTHETAWSGNTSVSTSCVSGRTYRFKVTLTLSNGVSGDTGWHSYLCSPPSDL